MAIHRNPSKKSIEKAINSEDALMWSGLRKKEEENKLARAKDREWYERELRRGESGEWILKRRRERVLYNNATKNELNF